MPNRPPREWFKRCFADVSATKAAIPGAVCGATWQRKSDAQKRATIRAEEGPMTKKKKKHAKKKKHTRAKARKKKKTSHKHHRCAYCGHASRHGRAGCTHTSAAGLFCPCRH
jgi:hypothetical protein